MQPVSHEKRRFARVPAKEVMAEMCVGQKTWACDVDNISAGGLFVMGGELLPVGLRVGVNVARRGWSQSLQLKGVVVATMDTRQASQRGYPPGMRIQFETFEGNQGDILRRLLAELGAHRTAPKLQGNISSPPPSRASVSAPILLERVARPPPGEAEALREKLADSDMLIRELEAKVARLEEKLAESEKQRSAAEAAVQRLSSLLVNRR
jgi:hypothetical protein